MPNLFRQHHLADVDGEGAYMRAIQDPEFAVTRALEILAGGQHGYTGLHPSLMRMLQAGRVQADPELLRSALGTADLSAVGTAPAAPAPAGPQFGRGISFDRMVELTDEGRVGAQSQGRAAGFKQGQAAGNIRRLLGQ